MKCIEVTLTVFLVMLSFSLLCFISLVSASTTFVGKYRITSYSFEPPSSTEYILTRTSGGSVQTHYGIFTNTSLDILSDMEFSGRRDGYSGSVKWEDMEWYYDANGKPILHRGKTTIKLNGEIESYSDRWEYGNYTGYYPAINDLIKADIGDKWTYTYERRVYEDEKYKETHLSEREIEVKDFPIKGVEAGVFSTVRVEEIEWEDGFLDTKSVVWRRLDDGKLIFQETYFQKEGEWRLLMKRELISEEEKEIDGTKEQRDALPISVIAISGSVLIAVITVSFLTYRLLKRRKKVSEMSLNE